MGGQACILYGGAEFSRDLDLAILSDTTNLVVLRRALDALHAETVAVPPLSEEYLERGHAVHFRARHPDADGLRIDVMARMRGVAPFEELWARRTSFEVSPGEAYDVLSLPDLVRAKKTQRDKDWPMIRRLLEADYVPHHETPSPERIHFWLTELRTPSLLIEAASRHPEQTLALRFDRPLLRHAVAGDAASLEQALGEEEESEREQDRAYWRPLREELQRLRHMR